MCGIAGIINLDRRPVSEDALRTMNGFMDTRGPDHAGTWTQDNIGLGHRRLSIIDLSPDGHQPMLTEDEEIVITFNGEIYNFPSLKKELEQAGVTFHSRSDTEVLLYGYRQWGIGALLKKIEGMYAFCLVDRKRKQAYLCRDVFGKKPLYYFHNGEQFIFASDLRSVTSQVKQQLTLNEGALQYYLSELAVPQPDTIWKEVKQVNSAHFVGLDLEKGTLNTSGYRAFNFVPKLELTEADAIDRIEATLIKAIKKRQISDVPIASFLSGGVDSGLIVALMAQHSSEPVNTFSVGFAEEDYSELPHAKALAERYETNHIELILEPNIQWEVHQIVDNLGEPFADSSIIPTSLVSKAMSQHHKVALSGDGGDELFGYPGYLFFHQVDEFLEKYPTESSRKKAVLKSKLLSRIGKGPNLGALNLAADTQHNGSSLRRDMAFSAQDLQALLTNPSQFDHTRKYLDDAYTRMNASSYADRVFAGSLSSRLLNDYLVKVDRASMFHALEVRSPFLDLELADLAFQLPNDLKFKNNTPKYLLKQLAIKHIDPDFLKRKKSGFSIPLKSWLRKELKPMMLDVLASDSIKRSGVFNPEKVKQLIKEHLTGKVNHEHRLWAIICFEMWYRKQS